jgi:hypothetical protein
MPAEGSAAAANGDRAGFEDADRFVFGAEPVRERWMGRPLAETRGWLELARLLADPVVYGVGVPRGDGRPVVLMPGFLAGDQTLADGRSRSSRSASRASIQRATAWSSTNVR